MQWKSSLTFWLTVSRKIACDTCIFDDIDEGLPLPLPPPPLQSQFILYFVAHSFWYVNRMARDASNEKIHNVFGLCTDCLWLEEEKKRVRFQRQIPSTSWGRVEKKSSNRFQAFFHMLSETRESSWLGFNSNLIDWLPRNASHSELEWGRKVNFGISSWFLSSFASRRSFELPIAWHNCIFWLE